MSKDDATPPLDSYYKEAIPNSRIVKPTVNKLLTKSDLPKTMQPHHWRHLFSGGISFALSVATGIAISEVHHRWPREVHWQDGTVEKGYKRGFASIPPNGAQFQLGVCDDGTVIWREAKKVQAERTK